MAVSESLDGLGRAAKASGMVVQHPCAEREQPDRAKSVHADMMMGLFIAHHVIVLRAGASSSMPIAATSGLPLQKHHDIMVVKR